MSIETIENYVLKENRLKEIKQRLESVQSSKEKINVPELIQLRDEADKIAGELKEFLNKTFK